MAQQTTRRFLRLPEVIHTSGYGRTAIYEKIKTGEFPKPYPLGARAVGWLAEDIEAWIESRLKAREAQRMKTLFNGRSERRVKEMEFGKELTNDC